MSSTLGQGSSEDPLHVPQLLHARIHFTQPALDQLLNPTAGSRMQQLRHIIQGEPGRLRGLDETESVDLSLPIEPVVRTTAPSCSEQASTFVVAHRGGRNSRCVRKLSDRQVLAHTVIVTEIPLTLNPGATPILLSYRRTAP